MNECEVCFREVDYLLTARFMGDLECNECRDYREYYERLTPEQMRAEHEAMALRRGERGVGMTTRLNVNINDECAAALSELAEREETTVTEIVRRAISVYKYATDEMLAGKKVLFIEEGA